MADDNILRIARQPILDRHGAVAGYELLYRSSSNDSAAVGDARTMSWGSLQALLEIGLEEIVGPVKAFYNIDFDVLDLTVFDTLPRDQLVLEILESTEPTKENRAMAKDLKDRGFSLALDDYQFQPHLEPFLEYVEIVKLECSSLDPQKDGARIRRLAGTGKKLLAEKLEEMSEFQAYKRLGCDLFQGYYFAKPAVIEGSTIQSSKSTLLNFLAKIHQENISIREMEEIVASDPTLAFKLLRQVHSAAFAAPAVQTVGQAILFLGLKPTAALATVLILSAVDNRPNELLVLSLTRAKMCEELGRSASMPLLDAFFTAGLLSTLDAYLDQPMTSIVEALSLSVRLKDALLGRDVENGIFRALTCVHACELGDFAAADACGFSPENIQQAYHKSIRWADEMNRTLKQPIPA